jgi:hypothetical protein
MGYLFGHHSGSPFATAKAIATLQEFDAFFRKHTASDYAKPAMLRQLTTLKKRMQEGIGEGKFRFTIREISDISRIYVYCGMTSSVNWADSLRSRRLIFDNVMPATAAQLFPKAKPHPTPRS